MSDSNDKRQRGIELAQKLFAGASTGVRMPKTLQRFTFEHLFGDVWQGDDLSLEERSLLTCTTLVALNREAEQHLHFVGARNLGIPREKIEGMIAHVAHYAGWPCAASASRVLNEVWPEGE